MRQTEFVTAERSSRCFPNIVRSSTRGKFNFKGRRRGKEGEGGHCERMHSKIVFADFGSDVSQAAFAFSMKSIWPMAMHFTLKKFLASLMNLRNFRFIKPFS